MRKKKLILIILILTLCLGPLMAQGASEIVTGGFSGALGGATAGSFLGPVGTVIGAGIGLVGGLFAGDAKAKANKAQKDAEQLQLDKTISDNYFNTLDKYNQTARAVKDYKLDIMQMDANISTYDQAIERWAGMYAQQRNAMENQAFEAYAGLRDNLGAVSNYNAIRGQEGGTADIIARQQKKGLVNLVGRDLTFDDNGGSYGSQMREWDLDMTADYDSIVKQREIDIEGRNMLVGEANKLADALASDYETAIEGAKLYAENTGKNWEDLIDEDGKATDTAQDILNIAANGDYQANAKTAKALEKNNIAQEKRKKRLGVV